MEMCVKKITPKKRPKCLFCVVISTQIFNLSFIGIYQIKNFNIFLCCLLNKIYFVRFFFLLLVLEHVTTRNDEFRSLFKTRFTLQIEKGIT